MGGEHKKRRYPGFVYLTGILLIIFLVSGCSTLEIFQPTETADEIRLQELLTHWENQVRNNAFHEAMQTHNQIVELLRNREPHPIRSEDLLYQQALTCQILLDQLLADRAEQKDLADHLHKTRQQLNKKAQSINSLKALIKNLNQTIHTLETQNNRLEKQIERMKQIDLK